MCIFIFGAKFCTLSLFILVTLSAILAEQKQSSNVCDRFYNLSLVEVVFSYWLRTFDMEGTFKSPRPIPNIVNEATFSHRKTKKVNLQRRVVEEDCLPPRAPVKSAPPISRVFKHTRRNSEGALQVSFRENGSSIL